jgi:anti-sigma-K factor RskA
MTQLSHEEVDELLAAYALGALPEDQRRQVEEHLAGCDRHRDALGQLTRAAEKLADLADERAPSPDLRQRIMTAVSTTPQIVPPSIPVVMPAPATAPTGLYARWRPGSRIAALAVAAVLLLGIGVAVGRLTAPPPPPQQLVAYTFNGNAGAPGAVAHLVYFKSEHRAVMEVTGLQPLTPGEVYELWLFRGPTPVPAGLGTLTSGTLVAQLNADLSTYQQVAITIEPGEQPKPTSNPILVGVLAP